MIDTARAEPVLIEKHGSPTSAELAAKLPTNLAALRAFLISDANGSVTLPQGQDTTRQESTDQVNNNEQQPKEKKKKKRAAGAAVAAEGGILNSPIVIGAGAAAIVGVTTWVLLQSSNPASPSTP